MACKFIIDYTNEEETHWILCDIILSVTDEESKECAWETIGLAHSYNRKDAFMRAWLQACEWASKLTNDMNDFATDQFMIFDAESYGIGGK